MISWVNGQKQENLLQFNTSWLASLRIWYYFRLFSSFSCPCYDLILIKKSQINWSLTYYSHVKILFFDFTWKKFCSRKWWVGGGLVLPPAPPLSLRPCNVMENSTFYALLNECSYYQSTSVFTLRISRPEMFLRKGVLKICLNLQENRTPMLKCDFNNVALQLYSNGTSAWAFSCKFAAFFQSTIY